MAKTGLCLINLGTPDDPSVSAVRRYLKQFLTDPRVIDLPALLRYILCYGFILPFRPRQSAAAYQSIWQPEGSPLLTISQEFSQRLAAELGDDFTVSLGMRYGRPSIESALDELRECSHIVILPLFPQYSSAATGSAIAEALRVLSTWWNTPSINVLHDFYQQPGFIRTCVRLLKTRYTPHANSMLLFSYHGLPERHIDKSECRADCDKQHTCPPMSQQNRFCYRAQCYATTRAIAEELGLPSERYRVAFQSRLGKTPWIKPYTDELLAELYQEGVRDLAVVCPSFVADCLETLEEIGIRAREDWLALGGETFSLIPCVNSEDDWVASVAEWLRPYASLTDANASIQQIHIQAEQNSDKQPNDCERQANIHV